MTNAVGLIGYGAAGAAIHAPAIAAAGLTLAAVASSRLGQIAADWPDARAHLTPGALIADPAVALVVIAAPNHSHVPLARAALAAGKHVVIDKPMALSSQEALGLIAAADKAGRLLSVFHNRRWDGDFMALRAAVQSGAIGELYRFQIDFHRFRPVIKPGWRETDPEGAGVLWDLGPHLIDQAIVLTGVPDAVSADILAQRPGAQATDYFQLTLHYGVRRAVLSASCLIAEAGPRLAAHGDKGSVVTFGLPPGTPVSAALTIGEERQSLPCPDSDWPAFYRGMAAAMRGQAPVPVDPLQAYEGLRVLEAALQSAATGQTVPL